VFALLALLDTPLGIANSMFIGIALGVGLDFSIHLTAVYTRVLGRGLAAGAAMRHAFEQTAGAIIISAGTIITGFSLLMFSEVRPNLQLGLIVCLSLFVCATATVTLVPCLAWRRDHQP
jgi:uncharacterized protein